MMKKILTACLLLTIFHAVLHAASAEETKLPKVLIIGDSISIGYTKPVQQMLKGVADVRRISGNGQTTDTGLKKIHQWLGDEKWDVIHFNWGLWDLCYRNPASRAQGNRDKINGTQSISPSEYEYNLRQLIIILKKTGARLIWANTTPVPEGEGGRVAGDAVKYNLVARKVMFINDVTVNDLHAYALERIDEIQLPNGNVHFTKEGSQYLAEQVVKCIRAELGLDFQKGGDISLLQRIDDAGGIYKLNGKPADALDIFRANGFNYMRLRLFHTPNGRGPVVNDLEYTLKLGKRIKDAGFALLLNFHYSDTWADPSHQTKPAVWQDLSFDEMENAVFEYTASVIEAFKARDTLPDMIQVGNEIGVGMLWDDGRIGGRFDTDKQWSQFARLVRAGIRGVRQVLGEGDSTKIMIHIAEGGDKDKCRWFYDNLRKQQVQFDVIGVSFYPWWHGSLSDLRENLAFLTEEYQKDIVVVEVAYPWTDKYGLPRGSKDYKLPYPPTPTGQAEYLSELISVVKQTPDNRGKGVFYWAPEWISTKDFRGNWSQLNLFDFEGNALPGLTAFKN